MRTPGASLAGHQVRVPHIHLKRKIYNKYSTETHVPIHLTMQRFSKLSPQQWCTVHFYISIVHLPWKPGQASHFQIPRSVPFNTSIQKSNVSNQCPTETYGQIHMTIQRFRKLVITTKQSAGNSSISLRFHHNIEINLGRTQFYSLIQHPSSPSAEPFLQLGSFCIRGFLQVMAIQNSNISNQYPTETLCPNTHENAEVQKTIYHHLTICR